MSKVIKNFTKNFTIADNRVAQCEELDLNAKGLYLYIASLPNDWEFSIERIARANNTTEGKVKRAIEQLEKVGLLKRHYELNVNGKRGVSADYEVFDFDTRIENSTLEISTPKNSRVEKLGVYINNKDTKKESHKEIILQTPYNPPKKNQSFDSKAVRESFEKVRDLYKQVKPAKNDLIFQNAEMEFFRVMRSNEISCSDMINAMEQQVELWTHKIKEDPNNLKYIPRLESWLEKKSYFDDFEILLAPYKQRDAYMQRGLPNWGDNDDDSVF